MINKKIFSISATSLLLSLSACGGGSGANSGASPSTPPQPTTTKTVFVPATNQLRTLSSYNTDFGNNVQSMPQAKLSQVADTPKNPCFAIKTIAGQKLSTSFTQWGGVSISFDVTNTCTTAQPINNMSVLVSGVTMNNVTTLLLGGQVQSSPWLLTSSPSFDTKGNLSFGVSTQSITDHWAFIQPNSDIVISYKVWPAVAVSSFSATDVTIDGGTPPPPPPAKTGDLYVGLSAASLQQVCGEQACNLTVNVIDPTSTILESINFNPKINPNQIIAYTHLATGNYTVSAVNNSLPAGTIVYYTPNNGIVSVNSDESSQVEVFFNYEKPAKLASLHFNLSNVSESAFNNFGTINATLVDNTLGESSSLPITLGSTVDVNNLPANHVYSVSLPGIADAYSGVVYSKLSQGNLTPNNQTVNLAYAKNTDAKYTSTFTLQGSGGSDVPSGQVVSFGTNVIDGNSDYVYTRNEPLTNNHVYQFLTPETVAITINPPVNYTVDYTPRVISKDSHDVVVTYAKSTPPVYTTVNATYWSAWGNNTSYDVPGGAFNSVVVDMPNIDKSYNVIITAFIVTKNNGEYMLATYDPSSQTPTAFYTDAQIQDFVARTKAQGRKVIVAVGGQYFNLKMSNQTDEQLFVTQIETIIDKYGFDGLDLDLEGVAADPKTINTTLLGEAVKTIISNYRNKGDDFWLTMAPEWVYIIPVGYGCGQWGTHSYYNSFYVDLVKNIGIDNVTYIWTQTYNQGEAQGICDNTGNKISPLQGMDNFVADLAWAATTDAGHIANNQGVNSATQMPLIPANKFVIGMPAAIGAAGGVDKYYLSPLQISNAWTIMKNNGINAGGFMNWAADWDATPHAISSLNYSHEAWETGRAVANVIHK